jgi:hypothetical protein
MARSLRGDAAPLPRLDRALAADVRTAASSPAVLGFLGLELLAAGLIVSRRGLGGGGGESIGLLWLGLGVVAFLAWWAGRHRLAVRQADPVGNAGGRALAAGIGAVGVGLATWGLAPAVGGALVIGATAGWLWFAFRGRGAGDRLADQLLRDPRPFLPLLLLIALPRAVAGGPGYALTALVALPSGLLQELGFLIGFFAPLEAVLGRTDRAAILSALVFGLLHVPMNLGQADGDLLLAAANAVVFQASVGAIACLGFVRHRAAVPLGVAHALAIA